MGDDNLIDSDPTETGSRSTGTTTTSTDTRSNSRNSTSPRDTHGTENATVYVEGEAFIIDEETTAAELKDLAGAADKEILTFRDGDQLLHISDEKYVLDHADPKTKFEFQPVVSDDGGVFG